MSDDVKDEIARYRELLRRDPRSRVFAPLAEAYRKEGRLDEALALAREGVTHHPAYAGGWLALARVRLDLGRVQEAAEDLERAVAASPTEALAWRLLGETRARLRDRGGAFEAFARALALDPLDDGARRAILDIDSPIGPSVPEAEAPAPILVDPQELDLSLEVLEEAGPPPEATGLSEIEIFWLGEKELSLFLVPEVPLEEGADQIQFEVPLEEGADQIQFEVPLEEGADQIQFEVPLEKGADQIQFEVPLEEGADPVFHAGRLDVLDIVHSSLAPEALADAEPARVWELPDLEPPHPEVPRPEVPRAARADYENVRADYEPELPRPEFPRAARADYENVRADYEPEAGESHAPAPDLRTETLADLYVEQGHVERAREIYRLIVAADPLHLRVKKKLLSLPAPAPATGQCDADRRIADLGRWLDRARRAADRMGRVDRTGGKDSGISTGIFTPPPTDEGR